MKAAFYGGPRNGVKMMLPDPVPPSFIFPLKHEEYCFESIWSVDHVCKNPFRKVSYSFQNVCMYGTEKVAVYYCDDGE